MIHQRSAVVVEHVTLAARTFRIRIHCPEIAAAIRPGQFVMVRLGGTDDPLLGRPFALYDTVLDSDDVPIGLDVVYLVVGKMTGLLADVRPGDRLDVWGPLGNGFPDHDGVEHVVCVAGGIGQTPFLAYAREPSAAADAPAAGSKRADRVSLYGVRTAALAAGVQFRLRRLRRAAGVTTGRSGSGFVTRCSPRTGRPAQSSGADRSRCFMH